MVKRVNFHVDYDSHLDIPSERNISGLSILLRVHLNPFNPAAGTTEGSIREDNILYKFQHWKPAEFQTFQNLFKRDAEFYLNWPNMGLWLMPSPLERLPDAAAEMQALKHARPLSPRFGPVVQCGLTVILVDTAAKSHVSFDVLRLKDGEPDFRSYVTNRANRRDQGMLTHRDVNYGQASGPNGTPQNVVAHEIGHVLNLDHINRKHPRCVRGNEDICYGARGTAQRRNWQGEGNLVTTANAMPWLRAIYRHTSSLVWVATDQMPKEMHFLR